MNYTYDMSFMNTSNNLQDIMIGVNTASGGIIGLGIMIVLFIGLMAAFMSKNIDFGRSMIITSFICTIVAGLLFFMNFLAWWSVAIFIIALIVSVIIEAFG
jgi:hypothetical protein